MRPIRLPTESPTYPLPQPPLSRIRPENFTWCAVSAPPGAGARHGQWLQWVYMKALEEARAVARPSLPERDLLGVWN
jgi:hypothetical protein